MNAVDRNPGRTSPHDWDRLLMDVINNGHRAPAKYIMPQIKIILKNFEEMPIEKIGFTYLTKLYDIASVRRHQGNSKKAWFMNIAYGELLSVVEAKMYEKTDSDGHTKIRPAQMKLPLEVRSA